jgi:hypothetical protein
VLLARPALAEKAKRDVRLGITDCTPSALDLPAAYAAAALELGLGAAKRDAGSDEGGVELEAALACEHGVKARLTLRTADSSAARTITLDDTNERDRARVLALALAELVRAEWRWVTTGKSDDAEAPPGDQRLTGADAHRESAGDAARNERDVAAKNAAADDAADVPVGGERSADGLRLEALGRVRALFEGRNLTYGGAAGVRWHRWSAGVEALFGTVRAKLGTATGGVADARVAFELLRLVRGRFHLSAEPGVAAGATWLSGRAASPTVQVANATRWYADARLALRAELLLRPLSPTLSLEGGRAAGFAATEGGRTVGATGGWFAGGALGVTLGGP